MKNTEVFATIRRLLLILTALCLCLSGCGQNVEPEKDQGLESGFYFPYGLSEIGVWHAACRSEKSVFDINDVTLTFYYGDDFGYEEDLETYREHSFTYEYYELYFANDNNKKILIRHVDEDFVSEKHRCKYRWNESGEVTEIIFNHSEELTIPKELFTKEKGIVYFYVTGWGTAGRLIGTEKETYRTKTISDIPIYYEKDGNTIKLTRTR